MLEEDPRSVRTGPRELIAQLAAAVMIADGHVTEAELCAVEQLRDLGLGPLSALVDAQIERAMRTPVDVAHTAAALARLAPDAGGVIVSSLARIAASDHELSRRELEVLSVVAEALGLSGGEAAHVIRSAAASCGAAMAEPSSPCVTPRIKLVRTAESPRIFEIPAANESEPRHARGGLEWALPVLGLDAGASAEDTDAAYATLVRRYNPAVVLDLGPEFAVLAVQRLNMVTEAYVAARKALAER